MTWLEEAWARAAAERFCHAHAAERYESHNLGCPSRGFCGVRYTLAGPNETCVECERKARVTLHAQDDAA